MITPIAPTNSISPKLLIELIRDILKEYSSNWASMLAGSTWFWLVSGASNSQSE
uniref:Uncharacterized protein n=1 Tax=Arundo donax TaxID=35708 RepID=A0A0A9C8B9_ARUDO